MQNQNINNTSNEVPSYKGSTHDLVSRVAYLVGISKKIFESDANKLQVSVYEELDAVKSIRIVRNLCIVRSAILRGRKAIATKMMTTGKTIMNMPEFIPKESTSQLVSDGIIIYKKNNVRLNQHIAELNRLISNRINNCKDLFPMWINWDYIKNLVVMPDGHTEDGVMRASKVFYANLALYPYKCYINWEPKDCGCLFSHDKKLAMVLYEMNGDTFCEPNKVTDVNDSVKNNIYEFINRGKKVSVVVDCENSDPYQLCTFLRTLSPEHAAKISSIIVFDDEHTATTWRIIDRFTDIPVCHMLINRVKEEKSLVDAVLITKTCSEFYRNNVDSFILVSSDSDYWGMISNLPEAKFLVMCERDKVCGKMKELLTSAGVFYCYIDDFYSGDSFDILETAIFCEMKNYIEKNVNINVKTMFEDALLSTRIPMDEDQKKQFFAKYLKTIRISIEDDGRVVFEFKYKT